jgi:hypothetical protein
VPPRQRVKGGRDRRRPTSAGSHTGASSALRGAQLQGVVSDGGPGPAVGDAADAAALVDVDGGEEEDEADGPDVAMPTQYDQLGAAVDGGLSGEDDNEEYVDGTPPPE